MTSKAPLENSGSIRICSSYLEGVARSIMKVCMKDRSIMLGGDDYGGWRCPRIPCWSIDRPRDPTVILIRGNILEESIKRAFMSIDSTRAKRGLGFKLAIPPEEGILITIEQFEEAYGFR